MQMIRSFKSGAIMCVIIAGVAGATRGGPALLRRMMNKRARKFYTHTHTDRQTAVDQQRSLLCKTEKAIGWKRRW